MSRKGFTRSNRVNRQRKKSCLFGEKLKHELVLQTKSAKRTDLVIFSKAIEMKLSSIEIWLRYAVVKTTVRQI